MNFSDLFKQTGQLCEFSPNGKYLANAVQYQLVIRDKLSLEITHIFSCLDTISYLEVKQNILFHFRHVLTFNSVVQRLGVYSV